MHAGSRVVKRPSSVRVHHFQTERCDNMVALLLLARKPKLIYYSQYRSLPVDPDETAFPPGLPISQRGSSKRHQETCGVIRLQHPWFLKTERGEHATARLDRPRSALIPKFRMCLSLYLSWSCSPTDFLTSELNLQEQYISLHQAKRP